MHTDKHGLEGIYRIHPWGEFRSERNCLASVSIGVHLWLSCVLKVHGNFITRAAQGRRVIHHRNQDAVFVGHVAAKHQRWPDFGSHAEVDLPDFTALYV